MSRRRSSKKVRGNGQRNGARRGEAPPAAGPIHVRSRAAFERFLDDPRPVMVDFWAPWCGPCRAMAPSFDKTARDHDGAALFLKVNTEEVPELASAFGIRSIPTVVVLVGDEVVNSHIGVADQGTLDRMVRKALDKSQGVTLATKLKRLFSRDKLEDQASAAG